MAKTAGVNFRRIEDEPYMSPHQRAYFHEKLLRWRKELCVSLSIAERPLHSGEDKPADWIDAASVQTQAELSWANRERSLQIIREIDAALERLREGTYGFCIETGEEIGIKRLVALPIARFSVDAQTQRELRCRHYR